MATRNIRRKKTPQKHKPIPTKPELAYKYVQFSKRITVYVLVFWSIYRLAQLYVVSVAPETTDSLVRLVTGIDTMAIFFGGFYTANSVSEKALAVHKEVQKFMYSNTKDDNEETKEPKEETNNG